MSKQLRLDVAQLTDVGRKRPHNEDNMAYVIPKDPQVMAKKGALFIVADGMGGHAAGEVASEIAVDSVSNAYYQDDSDDVILSLTHAIKRANTLIHQRAAENMLRSGMGTTCVAAVLRGATAFIANVGDSRGYIARGGKVRQVTQDHSWVAEQVRAGLLTEEQSRSHAQRNVITRALGTQADVDVDIFCEHLMENDTFILCSDGLSGLVNDEDLQAVVDHYPPQESVYHLVERANENGGPDNITAIVICVTEVGWDPPGTRFPEHDLKDRATLSEAPTVGLPMNGRVPSAPLQLSTGPLPASNGFAAPLPPVASKERRSRLLYPTLALFVLLAVTLVGGGIYYLLHGSPIDVDDSIQQATRLVSDAKQDIAHSNPIQALRKLSTAQVKLRSAQNAAPTETQKKKISMLLNGDFTQTVQAAITSYNQQSAITSLSTQPPCLNTTSDPLSNGTANTQPNSIVTIQDAKGNMLSYALGEDHTLYQLDANKSLTTAQPIPGKQVWKVVSNKTQLFALTKQLPNNYSMSLLTPDEKGVLKEMAAANIDASFTQAGAAPSFITAWGTDIYVVITSNSAQNTAVVLNYTLSTDKNNKSMLTQVTQQPATISVSESIVSVAAFPHRQLFLLHRDGLVQSFTVAAGNQTPASVPVSGSITPPLAIRGKDFTPSTTVPTPMAQTASQFLAVPNALFLVAGTTNGTPHLYIVDNGYHRILDLTMDTASASAPPTATSIQGSAVGSTTGTPSTSQKMQLVQQYTDAHLLASVKSIVADPKDAELYLLVQPGASTSSFNIVSVNTSPGNTCAS